MSATVPYIILHLQLQDRNPDIVFTNQKEFGYYYVFWWNQIPLGHLYIEKNEVIRGDDCRKMIISAITPAITFYLKESNLIKQFEELFFLNDLSYLEIAEKAFSPYITTSHPKKASISVIICTRNRSESLKSCLESLHQQVCMPEEIIVVDNAPVDESTKNVAEAFPAVTYYKEVRPGLDIARNTGAMQAKCSLIAYTDDDVRVQQLWIYRIWEAFLNDNVDALTGLIISSSLDTESQQIFERYWGFNKGYQDVFYKKDFLYYGVGPRVWEIGAGANMAFRKQILEKVGFFDERLDVGAAGCSGDSEIWFRILAAGYTIQYTSRAIVYHEHRKLLSALQKQVFSYMRGHTAAVLIQEGLDKTYGYKRYLYHDIPKYYFLLLKAGFPKYSSRYMTLFSEIKGIISGILFYYRNREQPSVKKDITKIKY